MQFLRSLDLFLLQFWPLKLKIAKLRIEAMIEIVVKYNAGIKHRDLSEIKGLFDIKLTVVS